MGKISFVEINSFPEYSGGIETWLYNITKCLSESDRRILIISPKPETSSKPFFNILKFKNVELYRFAEINKLNLLYSGHLHYSIRIFLISFDYIVWTVQSFFQLIFIRKKLVGNSMVVLGLIPAIFPILLAKPFLKKIKIIGSVTGVSAVDLEEKTGNRFISKLYKKIEVVCLKKCFLVLSNGYDTQKYLEDSGVKSEVFPNGVDFRKFSSPLMEWQGNVWLKKLDNYRKNQTPIIMMVGTLSDLKGIPCLIQAVPFIREKYFGPFKVVFVGKGNCESYQKMANDLGAKEFVKFAGEQKEVEKFLYLADIAVGLSSGGGIANAPLEYMAAKKPIVAWDSFCYSQLLKDGKTALLAKNKNVCDVAVKIVELLNNKKLAAELAENALQESKNYDWHSISEKLAKFLNI